MVSVGKTFVSSRGQAQIVDVMHTSHDIRSAFRATLTGRSKCRNERFGLLAKDGGVLGLVQDDLGRPLQEELLVIFSDLHGLCQLLERLREVWTV